MDIVVSHHSAYELMMLANSPLRAARTVKRADAAKNATCRSSELAFACESVPALNRLTRPVELLVANDARKHNSKHIKPYRQAAPLPAGSLVELDRSVYAAGPCLCFLQLAQRLSLPKLILLGDELCGTYTRAVVEPQTRYNLPPYLNTSRLRRYLARITGVKGVKKARVAARYVVDGAASPLESAMEALLCPPTAYGAYGFEPPVMNYRIDAPKDGRMRVTGKSYCRGDLCWPQYKLDVEYDSSEFHAGADQIERDAERRTLLIARGFEVITVTRNQLYDVDLFHGVAEVIAKRMGRRLRITVPRFEERRAWWRSQVLGARDTGRTLEGEPAWDDAYGDCGYDAIDGLFYDE